MNPALVVIDAQQEYFAPVGKARARGVPVIHVVHESTKPAAAIFVPGSPALAIHPQAQPAAGEAVVTKHLPGAFTGTPLEEILRGQGIQRVILAGFVTQMCVDTTARQAAHRGFQVTVLADATAAMSVKGPEGEVPRSNASTTSQQRRDGDVTTS